MRFKGSKRNNTIDILFGTKFYSRRKWIMNLINKKVTHKVFGEGSIVTHNDSRVEIKFTTENKKFIYPDVFAQHLKLHDSSDAQLIEKMIEEKGEKLKEDELKKQEEKRLHLKKQQLRVDYEKMMHNHKLHSESQLVFWCDEEEQRSSFIDWNVFSGITKSGTSKGKPNKLNRLHQNSAVLLTARDTDVLEQERRILGLYMVKRNFIGKLFDDGNIPAHSKYKIQLTKEESDQLFFWTYYTNKKSPEKMTWNSGKHRYFDNVWLAQILLDILAIKKDPREKEHVQQFLKYFCKMNQLSIEELEIPTGVLARK